MSSHSAPTRTLPDKPSLAQLRTQAKEHRTASGHPFADETTMWDDAPGLKPTDLFDS